MKRFSEGNLGSSELNDMLDLLDTLERKVATLTTVNERLQKERTITDRACTMWRTRAENFRKALDPFIEKNFKGGSKANREDYSCMVTSADIYKLREVLEANKW
jgi:hypothetical protein